METVVVVGIGYVGLVAAACFAHVGHNVICIDIDEKKVEMLRKGHVPFFEPDLEPLIQQCIELKRLHFTTSYPDALQNAPFVVLAVDTPMQEDGSCDTTNIFRAARSLGKHCSHNLFVIVKSTVPVGTCALLEKAIQEEASSKNFTVDVVSNPEFLKEGASVQDFMQPDRIILGVKNERSEEMMRRLYAPFNHLFHKFIVMDRFSSELTKYASNTMLALRISYMNWLTEVCEKTGADIDSVRQGLGADTRIGPAFLRSGIGFGGSCFPKDIKALAFLAKANGIDASLIDDIDAINEHQKKRFSGWILNYLKEQHSDVQPCIVTILGLSFKAGTDDMRKAPSITVIRELLEAGVKIHAYDPMAIANAKASLTDEERSSISWFEDPLEAAQGSHAVVALTEWPQIGKIDLKTLRSNMSGKGLFDGRSLFTPNEASLFGFDYFSLGKPLNAPVAVPEYVYVKREKNV